MSNNFNQCGNCTGNNNNNNNDGCNDIPGGFQDMNPELFAIIGEIIGQIAAGKMPFNVQNAIGNWLQLVGQVILTYNAQQQYLESGPGKYYDIKNKNIQNSYCTPSDGSDSSSGSGNSSDKDNSNEIKALKDCICSLSNEIKKLKGEVNQLKRNR